MSALQLCCAVEGDYVPHSAAMLHSALGHTGGLDVHVHYLHPPELGGEARLRLAEMVERDGAEISFRSVPDEKVTGLPTVGFTGKATWYRILLPELLPDVGHALFLDADLIVLDDLEPLWRTDIGDDYLAAVTNVFQDDHLGHPRQLGIDMPQDYFNAGVMLLNLELMRRDGCTRSLLEHGRQNAARLAFRDQDTLNAVLGGRRRRLHPRWNLMNSMLAFPWATYVFGAAALDEARRRPAIRHFEGPGINKPWHFLCTSEMRERYLQLRRETPWPEVGLEGRTAQNIARRAGRAVRGRFSA